MCTWGSYHCFKCDGPTSIPREPACLSGCKYRHTNRSKCERQKIIILDAFVRRDHNVCPPYIYNVEDKPPDNHQGKYLHDQKIYFSKHPSTPKIALEHAFPNSPPPGYMLTATYECVQMMTQRTIMTILLHHTARVSPNAIIRLPEEKEKGPGLESVWETK